MAFTPEIFALQREQTKRSAAVVVPLVCEIARPETVVDVGCGEGWFAREFAQHGCKVSAFDEVVTPEQDGQTALSTPDGGELVLHHLSIPLPPFNPVTGGGFDLAVCLEVAEHLPESHADGLVTLLCRLAPIVLFSAAIPGQGGHGHVNERWPRYWADLFYRNEYVVHEGLRWGLWDDDDVEPWYRQNLLLAGRAMTLAELGVDFTRSPRSVVHPVVWEHRRQRP